MTAFRLTTAALAIATTSAAQAQPIIVADSGDNGWMLAAALLMLITTLPGLALFYDRSRSGGTGLALLASTAITTLVFAVIGYSLAFSDGTGLIGGAANAMLADLADVQPDMTISGTVYALFELAVAIFAVAILLGSISGRTRIGWLLAFAALWMLFVYVPVAHWVWGGGWIAVLGALDYGGGIVVQTTAGVSALVIALLVGRDHNADVVEDPRMMLGGAGILLVGWLALIGGSSFAATDTAAEAVINAQLAASAAVLTGLLIERLRTGSISAQGAALSAMAGLAAVSAGAGFIAPAGAIIIGIIGATGAAAAAWLVRVLNLSSASTAFIAHGGGAIPGAILFPLFVLPGFGGPGFDDGLTVGGQIATQGIAVLAVALWAAIATGIAALMISMVLPMVNRDAQT